MPAKYIEESGVTTDQKYRIIISTRPADLRLKKQWEILKHRLKNTFPTMMLRQDLLEEAALAVFYFEGDEPDGLSLDEIASELIDCAFVEEETERENDVHVEILECIFKLCESYISLMLYVKRRYKIKKVRECTVRHVFNTKIATEDYANPECNYALLLS